MSDPGQSPVRLCSLDEALAEARGRGLAVVILGDEFALAFSTPFGPCLRRHGVDGGPGDPAGFLLRVLAESSRGAYSCVAVAGASGPLAEAVLAAPGLSVSGAPGSPVGQAEGEAALGGFARQRVRIPVHSGRGGDARARVTTIAPCHGVAYERGAVLRAAAEDRPDGCVIRWRRQDGGDAGIHLVLGRQPTGAERSLVAEADGVVVSVVPGAMPWRGGTRRIQTLVLDVPHAFAEAFPDGRMPRHGLAGAA